MSTESHNSAPNAGTLPENDAVAFETSDVKARTIYVYLAVLAAAVIFSYVVSVFVLRVTTRLASESDAPPPPVRGNGQGLRYPAAGASFARRSRPRYRSPI